MAPAPSVSAPGIAPVPGMGIPFPSAAAPDLAPAPGPAAFKEAPTPALEVIVRPPVASPLGGPPNQAPGPSSTATSMPPVAVPMMSPVQAPTPSRLMAPGPAPSQAPVPGPSVTVLPPVAGPVAALVPAPTPSATSAPATSPTPAPTPLPTLAPTPSTNLTPMETPAPTELPTPAPAASPTPAPAASPTPAPTPSSTPAPAASPTPATAPPSTLTPTPSVAPAASPTPSTVGAQLPALKLVDNQFVNADTGSPVALKGMSWFGFNNGQTMVDGFYAGSTFQVADFKTIVFRQQLLGFNAVRLPMTFSDLNLAPKSWTKPCTDDTEYLKGNLTNPTSPYSSINTASLAFPSFAAPSDGMCNSDLPNDSTLNRYLYVIQYYIQQGFYVLVDYHAAPGDTTVSSGNFISDWQTLWTAITALPNFSSQLAGRMFLDLCNEPDGLGLRWEDSNGSPGMTTLYLQVMDALYAIDSNVIFFVEGTGQNGIGAAWGDGFVTDGDLISQDGLSDPRPFFDGLLSKPYVDQVVLSPHVYGRSVTGGSQTTKEGTPLWNRLSASFGSKALTGYTSSSCTTGCTPKRFPIAIGEFGTTLALADDLSWLRDLSSWINNISPANDGQHSPVTSFFYWCWNDNSGDTGGLVDDSWLTIEWAKVNFLTVTPNGVSSTNSVAPGGWGLTPWYLQ
ncbi:probable major extracellular endoglucanase [Coccomyxa sp. Obi]|nr:probable major extracellular endoglucanase [Coccomyxa sp. Obi]